jgi:hypothetical protein
MIECIYCKRKCRSFKPDPKSSSDVTSYYRCDYHGAVTVKHYVGLDQNVTSHSLVAFYKDTQYQAVFFHYDGSPSKFRIDRINPYPRTTQTVMTLDFHPDITPENVQDKIKTYIMFS